MASLDWKKKGQQPLTDPLGFLGGGPEQGKGLENRFQQFAGNTDTDLGLDSAIPFDQAKFIEQPGMSDFVSRLTQQSKGQGPSVAQQEGELQRTAGINQLAAQRASQRGVNPALAARMQQQQSANLSGQIAGSTALGRLKEQQMAQQGLGAALGNQQQIRNQIGMQSSQQSLQEALQRRKIRTAGVTSDKQAKRGISKSMAENTTQGMGKAFSAFGGG